MINKAKIKVIKKNELKATEKPSSDKVEKKANRVVAREMVSTVTNWVTEFQRNKREETKQAFEQLFAAQAQVREV